MTRVRCYLQGALDSPSLPIKANLSYNFPINANLCPDFPINANLSHDFPINIDRDNYLDVCDDGKHLSLSDGFHL